jgi:hypothetical protein
MSPEISKNMLNELWRKRDKIEADQNYREKINEHIRRLT